MNKKLLLLALFFIGTQISSFAQQSVARRWNEALIASIRQDFARPPVHARNLYYLSAAMYDAWAAYDTIADTYLLGKQIGPYTCPFNGVAIPADVKAAREMAMSYTAFRIILQRFQTSPNAFLMYERISNLMYSLGYDPFYSGINYADNNPASLGNYIAKCYLELGNIDGANESGNYAAPFFYPTNPVLQPELPGNPNLLDPNAWQPLQLLTAVDQNGNPIPATQVFQSPLWGQVIPFALSPEDTIKRTRGFNNFIIYNDPGAPPMLDTSAITPESDEFKWNMALVAAWGSHHSVTDGVYWDISPAAIGNVQAYPETFEEYQEFYDFVNGGDNGTGRAINPKTGQPYASQIVPRSDYTRVLAEFWADGPNSETPPGHWYSIYNKTMDNPLFVRKFNGQGPELDPLEWDVKTYFILGGALHDAAITAWGIKGWYNAIRPISAIRYMADKGQSAFPNLPYYHPAGLPVIPGFIELIQPGDTLAGANNEHVGKAKIYSWKGPNDVTPTHPISGVGWVLAQNWWTFQKKTFVTPPFGGFISGHSTFSSAAAEALTLFTGDPYFPGGLGEFAIDTTYMTIEKGPSVPVVLQWATYRDASDQTSLSRIWGGIHPPFDDIPGRKLGKTAGEQAYFKARAIFYKDEDLDGSYSYEDCDDHNPNIRPGLAETCDSIDNNCNGLIDEDIPVYQYFADGDGDGYGIDSTLVQTCNATLPVGFVTLSGDCDDTNAAIFPGATEVCDGIDNNCDGDIDNNLPFFTYYTDADGDGFGVPGTAIQSCETVIPVGLSAFAGDCDDTNPAISPAAVEVCDTLDNNCNGLIDDNLDVITYYPDADGDGFGDLAMVVQSCNPTVPTGFVLQAGDCDDTNASVNPLALEIEDDLDNNCNGIIDDVSSTGEITDKGSLSIYPNPTNDYLMVQVSAAQVSLTTLLLHDTNGRTVLSASANGKFPTRINVQHLPQGIYYIYGVDDKGNVTRPQRIAVF